MDELTQVIVEIIKDLPGTGALFFILYMVNHQFSGIIEHAATHLISSNEHLRTVTQRLIVLEDKLLELTNQKEALSIANAKIAELERRLDERQRERERNSQRI